MLFPSCWAPDDFIYHHSTTSSALPVSVLPHHKPLLPMQPKSDIITPPQHSSARLCQTTKEAQLQLKPPLVVNMHLMWAANYVIWVAHCYSWCRSKWGLQRGDFNTSNIQHKIHTSFLSNLFHRMFSVQVDEDKVQTQRLPSDQPISVKKVFVGGTSSQFQTAPLRNIPPFEGCIWNLVINAM